MAMSCDAPASPPGHGGRLNAAARHWGIPREQWLDLSTGINPVAWPVPQLPETIWQRLPEEDDGLAESIRLWCGAPADACCLPVAGSQAAIQALPQLLPRCRVGIPVPGYREHGYWWRKSGHQVAPIPLEGGATGDDWLDALDWLVWIHPNNPTGLTLPVQQLELWRRKLAARGGGLVVDEAFVAPGSKASLAAMAGRPGLIILRSLGKFFGLAGVRAGAVLGPEALLMSLSERLGPWAMSGPARHVMARALADTDWQTETLERLVRDSERLRRLLADTGLGESSGTILFRYLVTPDAGAIHQALARQGVLVRLFKSPSALRFGLPGSETEWQRLALALGKCH
ncbi:threonine-phosphate decarboxylase CobD [Marinobacter oulmenensis]|uniref:threonine-phosphate decarboxylase n=1 Tax=Marinobacter oulmenensis TaxID=643747 RepID=A0A840UEC0_9GAMM|nr:threonine-phosphate decarboxylase CobD [Marinobacter oulmenensis]MBB5321051.1 cobalamin biosynthetic protein CobC [Marinobacter oulmenensis]